MKLFLYSESEEKDRLFMQFSMALTHNETAVAAATTYMEKLSHTEQE